MLALASVPPQHRLPSEAVVAGLCIMKVVAPDAYEAARRGTLTFAQAEGVMHFSEWRNPYRTDERSQEGKWAEANWRFVLKEDTQDEEISSLVRAAEKHPFRGPPTLPSPCEIIDGFSFPG